MKIDLTSCKPELCLSEDESRPHLVHPYLNVEEKRLEATSGHILGLFPVEVDKGDVSGHIDRRVLSIEREGQVGTDPVSVTVPKDETRGLSVRVSRPRCGKFPPLGDLLASVPRRGDAGTVTFGIDAELLRKLSDAIGASGGRRVLLTVRTPTDPIRVESFDGAEGDAFGVIMGLRL